MCAWVKILRLSVLLLAAFVFVLFFSAASSPLYGYDLSDDSVMFKVIGLGWSEGVLPYVGLWDSKGPFIFFIDALGYTLSGSDSDLGIFLIEVLSVFSNLIVVHRWLSRSYGSRRSLLLTLVVLAGLSFHYYWGNMTAEYLLPFITLSFYLMYRWMSAVTSSGNYEHKAGYAFIYGIVLGLSMMSRLTNAIGVCTGALVIAFFLVKAKLWKCLFCNIVLFLAGMSVAVLPFAIYFLARGAFADMLYGSLLYNIGYSLTSYNNPGIEGLVSLSFNALFCFLLMIVSVVIIRRGSMVHVVLWLAVSAVTVLYLFISYGYYNYGIITLPYLCAFFIELKESCALSHRLRTAMAGVALLLVFSIFIRRGLFIYENKNYYADEIESAVDILSCIPSGERHSFIAYNCNASVYLLAGITPVYPYFAVQDWAVYNNNSLKPRLLAEYSRCKAKWLLFKGDIDGSVIKEILENKYSIIKTDSKYGYSLFRLAHDSSEPVRRMQ